MKRTGFTLMELLLVVAILAIVAAAAAPTFTGGAAEALAEARKSSFMSAFQNTVSGCNLMLSVYAAKGTDMSSQYAADKTLDNDAPTGYHNLEYYVPVAARTFKNNNGKVYVLSAGMVASGTVIYYKQDDSGKAFKNVTGATSIDITAVGAEKETRTTSEALEAAWNAIKDI